MTDVYNGDWKTPAHTAMCLWEAFITEEEGTYPYFDNIRSGEGTNSLREVILGLVEKCDEAWLYAAAYGYDYAFDWDFCPLFLTLWCAKRDATAEELGMAIHQGWEHAMQAQRKGAKK